MSSPSASTVDSATLAEVAELEVFDRTGQKVRFGSIYKNQKVVIVFVRTSDQPDARVHIY